jgi:quinol-cytochrome oxidoreductase complex cytochrome b subunit
MKNAYRLKTAAAVACAMACVALLVFFAPAATAVAPVKSSAAEPPMQTITITAKRLPVRPA